jgi:hypothetical protein
MTVADAMTAPPNTPNALETSIVKAGASIGARRCCRPSARAEAQRFAAAHEKNQRTYALDKAFTVSAACVIRQLALYSARHLP